MKHTPIEAPSFDPQIADVIMPMVVVYDPDGIIRHIGPTIAKMRDPSTLLGAHMADVFEIEDYGRGDPNELVPLNTKLFVTFKAGNPTQMKGLAVHFGAAEVNILNLSFGLSIVEAVRDYNLSDSDFAHTDLAIEMLYLVEAKTAVLDEIKQLNARLQGAKSAAEEQALTDTLTGLKNRRAMDLVLARMIRGRVPFALMHLDLDFFKAVNDTHGHAAGDAVLDRVAEILREETREEDLVARVGGDEFILIFSRMTDHERLLRTSYRIIARLEEPILFNDAICRISGSVGITTSDFYKTVDADRMIHDADLALYASKHAGRATATIFDPQIHKDMGQSGETKEAAGDPRR